MRRLAAAFSIKRDKQPPPPLLTDNAHSSASSSSGSASLYLPTPDDEHHPIEIISHYPHSKKNWKTWLKSSKSQKNLQPKLPHNPIPDWAHELDDTKSHPSADNQHGGPTTEDVREFFTVIVKNSLNAHPPPLSPFASRANSSVHFPKSVNVSNSLRRFDTIASTMLKKRLLTRLQNDDRPLTQAELQSIALLFSRKTPPVLSMTSYSSPDLVNEPAPVKTTVFAFSSPGIARWISRPCFEDRYDVFLPQEDGSVSHRPVVGTAIAVAALEYSAALEAMIEPDFLESVPQIPLVIDVPSSLASDATPTSASPGYTRNSPYIAVPSPLRNEHNSPSPPITDLVQPVPPTVLSPNTPDPLIKRGVRFAEDDKDDIIPLGYVLRMKQKREEKAKFLRAERERRLLQEERQQIEEERLKRDLERAEWERERRAWEKEKRAMEEERQLRKYAEEVAATRLRRESHRAGGVPALRGSDTDTHGYLGSAGLHFPASATSSERNKPLPSRRQSKSIHGDGGIPPPYLPRREASEPNLPTIIKTSPNDARAHVTNFRNHSSNSNSPSSSRPDSIESSSPLPGTRSPSMHSSSSEDVKAAVARAKRNSVATPASRNNSSSSFTGERVSPYSVRSGSSPSLSNIAIGSVVPPVPPLPMIPLQMQMVPIPTFAMDMPLLPPTPPFMMQQYPRRQGSSGRSSRSSSKVRSSGSQNSSQERVNAITGSGSTDGSSRNEITPRSSSSSRPEYRHLLPSSSLPQTPPSREGSQVGESSSRRASMPIPKAHHYVQPQRQGQSPYNERRASNPAHPQAQPQTMSRGMSAQHLQPPSPWTGLPTQGGQLPNAQLRQPSLRSGASKRQTMIV